MRVLPAPTVLLDLSELSVASCCCLNNNRLKTQYAVSLLTIQ